MRLLVAENDPSLASFLNNGFGAEHYAVDLTVMAPRVWFRKMNTI